MSQENEELLRKADIHKIAEEGTKIYEEIKSNYEPGEKGKFLAIEIESKKVFLAKTSTEALDAARKVYPKKVFYVVKIGYDFAEAMARSLVRAD